MQNMTYSELLQAQTPSGEFKHLLSIEFSNCQNDKHARPESKTSYKWRGSQYKHRCKHLKVLAHEHRSSYAAVPGSELTNFKSLPEYNLVTACQ